MALCFSARGALLRLSRQRQKPFQFGYLSSKWMHELATNETNIFQIIGDSLGEMSLA